MQPTPEPMFSLALELAAKGDEQKISSALEKLCEEDPCFKVTREAQTKELVISGLGDLHLRVMLEKLEKRYKLSVNTKEPKIPYRETITLKARGITGIRSRRAEQGNSARFICGWSLRSGIRTHH